MVKLDAQNERIVRVKKGLTEKDAVSITQLLDHINNRKNPHLVTREQLGFTGGTGTTGDLIFNEDLTSQINGSNTEFTTINNFVSSSICVYYNGLRMRVGATNDYTVTDINQITFTFAPVSGLWLVVDYQILAI